MNNKFSVKAIGMISLVFILLASLCSCHSLEKLEYYSQKDNYINVSGTVSYINYNEDLSTLYIDFSSLSPVLDDTCFKIVGENLQIVKSKDIDKKLKIGESVTFITAPRYFGDGYVMPIVGMTVGGEELLNFDEGYENLLNWLSK